MGCFIYNGPHHAKDCLKREKLSTLMIVEGDGDSSSNMPSTVNPLQLLNVIHIIQKAFMHV